MSPDRIHADAERTARRSSAVEAALALLPLDIVAGIVPIALGAALARRAPLALLGVVAAPLARGRPAQSPRAARSAG